MFTKEFIKISQILDNHGMHRQADDLLRIAQQTQPTAPVKPAQNPEPTSVNTPLFVDQKTLATRVEKYVKELENLQYVKDIKGKFTGRRKSQDKYLSDAMFFKKNIDKEYINNRIDRRLYLALLEVFKSHNRSLNIDLTPVKAADITSFPGNTEPALLDSERNLVTFGRPSDDRMPNAITLANPLEGVTAFGEKTLPNREDRNLSGLVKEWNNYFNFKTRIESTINQANLPEDQAAEVKKKLEASNNAVEFKQNLKKYIADQQSKNQPVNQLQTLDANLSTPGAKSFEEQLQDRINELKNMNPPGNTTQLEELLKKVQSPEGLQAGDFGNKDIEGNPTSTKIYGVEAKPLTSITGTPTPPTPPATPTGSAATNPQSR